MKPYTIENDQWIHLTEGPYEGIVYKYGRVELLEEGEQLRIRFEYELDDGTKLDNNFVQYIGPILSELIEEGVMKNSIVYTGGVDAN
jgi:hypothetical protein